MRKHQLTPGAHVIFITPERVAVNALIEVVHAGYTTEESAAYQRGDAVPSTNAAIAARSEAHRATYGNWPCVNLTYIQPDDSMKDQYGRQKGHASSCSHGNVQGAPQGYCWIWPDEAPEHLVIGERVVFAEPVKS